MSHIGKKCVGLSSWTDIILIERSTGLKWYKMVFIKGTHTLQRAQCYTHSSLAHWSRELSADSLALCLRLATPIFSQSFSMSRATVFLNTICVGHHKSQVLHFQIFCPTALNLMDSVPGFLVWSRRSH